MKLNGTLPNRRVIFRDTIPGTEVFGIVNFKAPNSNEIPNFNIQFKEGNFGVVSFRQ